MITRLVLLFTLLFSINLSAQECEDSLNELFQNYTGDRSKIDEFLEIQAGITMHKLAYATLRNSQTKEQYRIENEILKMLNQVKDKYEGDTDFRQVYEMYNHPDNKLSRTALARVLPYLKDIINDQNGEQSAFRRRYFNIGLSDVRMLAILAQKETLRSNGVYDHRLFRNHAHDNSILNFVKVINSSVRNTNADKQRMLESFENRLSVLMLKAQSLLEEIGMPEACLEEFDRCRTIDEGKVAIDDNFLELIGKAMEKIDTEAQESLKYDDVWLYTKSRIQGTISGNKRNRVQTTNKERSPKYEPPKEVEVITPQKSDKEVVLEYLVNHILDKAPHLFTRQELMAKPEFTIAMAQAIDDGVLARKGDKRSFYFNGKKYVVPELWNGEYSELGMGRPGSSISTFFSRTFRIDEYDEDDISIPSSIPASLHDDFMTTMNDQWENFDHKYAFEFNGKLYRYPDAKPLEQGLETFLSSFEVKPNKGEEIPTIVNPLESEKLAEIANEVREGNRSIIVDGEVYHISGAQAYIFKEHARARALHESTNTVVNEDVEKVEFPQSEDVRALNNEYPALVLKALTDRDRVIKSEDKVVDIYTGREIDRSDAISTVVSNRVTQGMDVEGSDYHSADTIFLQSNAMAIMNKDDTFEYDGAEYYTSNGNPLRRDVASDTNSSFHDGMIDSQLVHDRVSKLNGLDDNELVLEYFVQNPHPSCEYISVVDKKDSALKVYRFEGARKILVFESSVGLGKEPGDQRTRYRNSNFSETNNRSGAGEYTFSSVREGRIYLDHPSQEGPSQNVAMGISASPKSSSEVLLNPRQTNGNIEIPEPEKSYFEQTYVKAGCPFIVLPETDQLRYKVIEDDLQLIPSSRFDQTNNLLSDYHFSLSEKVEPKKIEISLNDPRYDTAQTREFLDALETEKRQIMSDLNLTNDEYDQLVKLAFGIMGTESSFGEGDGKKIPWYVSPGAYFLGMEWNTYKFKESKLGQFVVSTLKGEVDIVPIYPGTTVPLSTGSPILVPVQNNTDNNSRGATQIKNVRDFLSDSYPTITQETLSEPRNSAIATMYALKAKMDILKRVEDNHSGITEENRLDYLYYMYLGSTNQITGSSATPSLNPKVREANGYGAALNIYTEP